MRSYRPMRRVGPNAFLPPSKAPAPGRCTWCKIWKTQLERDHVLPRSLFPGPHRDDPPNLVPACRRCNRLRADGKLKPSFLCLPKKSQAFVFAWWRPAKIERHFIHVPADPGSGSMSP